MTGTGEVDVVEEFSRATCGVGGSTSQHPFDSASGHPPPAMGVGTRYWTLVTR